MKDISHFESLYENCKLCPRGCGVNRQLGNKGVCMESSDIYVSRAALHMWEEPCISGNEGSGAVFFSGCNLHCVFCQNRNISNGNSGKHITIERLADIFLELQSKKANNINLVTATHYIPSILKAAEIARKHGLNIPFVYNSSGYETKETIRLLDGTVDIFLPDFKYINSNTATLFSKAPDYPDYAMSAIDEMVKISPKPIFDDRGIMIKGVIVRVLVLPEHTNEAIKIVRYLHEKYADQIYISIMSQYTPLADSIPEGKEYASLKRSLTKREYEKVIAATLDAGVTNAFFQDGKVDLESFIPAFDNEGV